MLEFISTASNYVNQLAMHRAREEMRLAHAIAIAKITAADCPILDSECCQASYKLRIVGYQFQNSRGLMMH